MQATRRKSLYGTVLLAAFLSGAPAMAGDGAALILSGTSVNVDNSTRALAAGRDGAAIRFAGRVIERDATRVEAAIARHNLCLAWMGRGGVEEAGTHCRFAAETDLGDVQVRRDGNFYIVVQRDAQAAGTESLQAVIGRNLAASLERLNAARIASTSDTGAKETN